MSGHRKRSGDRSGRQGKRPSRSSASVVDGVDFTLASKLGCSSGKWGWLDTPEGRKGARSLKKALRKRDDKPVREYVCPECGRWHVGFLPFEAQRGHRSANDVHAARREAGQ